MSNFVEEYKRWSEEMQKWVAQFDQVGLIFLWLTARTEDQQLRLLLLWTKLGQKVHLYLSLIGRSWPSQHNRELYLGEIYRCKDWENSQYWSLSTDDLMFVRSCPDYDPYLAIYDIVWCCGNFNLEPQVIKTEGLLFTKC